MGSRVRVEQFDDFDETVRPDVRTYSFMAPDGVMYEIDLHTEHYAEMELDFAKYIKAGRKVKGGKRRKTTKPSGTHTHETVTPARASEPDAVVEGGGGNRWTVEIRAWAIERGLDWDNKEVRIAVRDWAIKKGMPVGRTGVIPRDVMEAYVEAH